MKRKTTLRVLALASALLLLLTACKNPLDLLEPTGGGYEVPRGYYGEYDEDTGEYKDRSQYETSWERNLVNYNDMEYTRPDVEAMKQLLVETTEALQNAESFEEVWELDASTGEVWWDFYTMYSIANIKTYQDYNDAYWEEEYQFLVDADVELEVLNNELNRTIVEGPFAEEYRAEVGEYTWQSMQTSLLLTSPEVEDYKQERAGLSVQYNNELNNMTGEYEGKTYSLEDIYDITEVEEYYGALQAYFGQNVETFAGIYARMIELDKLTAATLGFDSAADMYYTTHERDYTAADALELCGLVKELFSDFPPYLSLYAQDVDYGTLMNAMPGILESVDTELAAAWADMLYYDLYDYEDRPNKQSGIGFTTYIAWYDAPFTYAVWDDTTYSANTIIHEFGHFYDFWLHYDVSTSNNMDIAECYSQGLEVLSQRFFGEFTEYPEYAVMYSLADLMDAVVYQAMLEEFQLRAYELEDLSAESLSGLFTELMGEYSYEAWLADENGNMNTWYSITHLFDYPFYTISYTTSAVVALQIFKESQRDWESAADIYLEMIHAEQTQPFIGLVESVGLKNPTDRATLEDIAAIYRDLFDIPESGARAA